MPAIVNDLEKVYADVTGQNAGEVGDQVQNFVERYTNQPDKLIGPLTSIGLNVAGVLGALVLILITAYYMAIRPEPLVNGLVRPRAAAAARARCATCSAASASRGSAGWRAWRSTCSSRS